MIHYDLSDGLCVLRLDAPPMNAIDMETLDGLRAALRRAAEDAEVRGIVVTGRADHFSAGADVGLFQEIDSEDDAVRVSRVFQEAFQAVEDSPKPVVAAMAGLVLGGAVELAAACHRRACAEGSRFRMPEVNLAINPGAGGTQRLPRLVGVEAALEMLLGGKTVAAEDALRLGLVDEVCPAEELIDRARRLALEGTEPRPTSRCVDRVQDAGANEAAFRKADELIAVGRAEILAPRKIVEAIRCGLEESFAAGIACERRAFAECMATPAARNKIYLFFATRQTAKWPELDEVQPGPLGRAAVVGMGSMGTGIAQALLAAGIPVVVCDEETAALERGTGRIRSSLAKRVSAGKLSQQQCDATLGLLSTTTRWEDLAEADLVIEAVFEEVETKRAVLRRLEEICRPQTVLATNTSTISLDALAESMLHPQRLIGVHFFNPAQRMPLVEVIRREGTAAETIATALDLTRRLRKTPVLVRNREGFVVNRLFIPYLKEAFWLLEEGAEPEAVDAAMVAFGFPMGPLALIDMAGLDILAATDRVMCAAFPDHGQLSPIAVRLVEAGQLGQKSGAGVYQYASGDYTPRHSQTAGRIIDDVRRLAAPAEPPDAEEITRRLVLRIVAEAYAVLQEGVARGAADVDVATVLGIGFPDFRGGVLRYTADCGLDEVRRQLDELTARHGARFAPCRLLRETKGAC